MRRRPSEGSGVGGLNSGERLERRPGVICDIRNGAPAAIGRNAPCRPSPLPGAPQWGQCSTPSVRSEEHTSELQSLMRISYAVFCLKKKRHNDNETNNT